LNKLIGEKIKDKREVFKEIVLDYPETKKKIKLDDEVSP
jgi:hypothetical protein